MVVALACIRSHPLSVLCIGPQEARYLQCSLFSVLFVGGCPLWEGSVPALLWEPLPRVALLDVVVPLQEAICCRSSVDTVTMHSSEGSEAAAAHELCMREPTLCRDFAAGAWAAERMADERFLATDTKRDVMVEASNLL